MCGLSRQLLQVFTIYFKFITKCDKCYYKVRQPFLLQSAMVCCYKVRQLFYYKVRQVLLQSATGITKRDNFITKCNRYCKVRRLLQSATVHHVTCMVHPSHAPRYSCRVKPMSNEWRAPPGGGGARKSSGRFKTQPKYIKDTCSLRNRRRFLGGRKKPRTACKKNNRRLLRSYADWGACGIRTNGIISRDVIYL